MNGVPIDPDDSERAFYGREADGDASWSFLTNDPSTPRSVERLDRRPVIVSSSTPRSVSYAFTATACALIAAVALALLAVSSGNNWRIEAQQAQRALTNSQEVVDDAVSELTELLERSEQDVRDLESRLADLADEKAQARDAEVAAGAEAQFIWTVAVMAADVVNELDLCVQYQDQWVDVLTSIGAGYSYNSTDIDTFIDDMVSTCVSAQGRAAALREYVTQ